MIKCAFFSRLVEFHENKIQRCLKIAEGIKKHNDWVDFYKTNIYEKNDCTFWSGIVPEFNVDYELLSANHSRQVVMGEQIKNNRTWFTTEIQLLGNITDIKRNYLRAGFWYSHNDLGKFYKDYDDTRFKKMQKSTSFPLFHDYKNGDDILILLNSPYSGSLKGSNHLNWLDSTISEIRNFSDRHIKIRPLKFSRYPGKEEELDNIIKKYSNISITIGPLIESLTNIKAAVSATTTASVDVVAFGIPHFTKFRSNFAYDVSFHDLSKIENPPFFDRTRWINKISYSQWSLEEFENGDFWNYWRPYVLDVMAEKEKSPINLDNILPTLQKHKKFFMSGSV